MEFTWILTDLYAHAKRSSTNFSHASTLTAQHPRGDVPAQDVVGDRLEPVKKPDENGHNYLLNEKSNPEPQPYLPRRTW